MTPTNKFNETVNTAAPEKKVSIENNGKQHHPPVNIPQDHTQVVVSRIRFMLKEAQNKNESSKHQ